MLHKTLTSQFEWLTACFTCLRSCPTLVPPSFAISFMPSMTYLSFFFPWKESRRRDIVIQDIKYFFFLNYLFLRIRYNHPKGLLIRNFCPEAEELSFWMETHSMSKVSTENQMRTVATKENPGSSFRVPCWFFLDPLLVVLKRLSIF